MNAIHLVFALTLAVSPLVAGARPADTTRDAGPTPAILDWDCARSGAPTAGEVRALLDIHDGHRIHRASLHLRELVKRGCAGGSPGLRIVGRPPVDHAPQWLVQRID
jgi:hypothetical protein